MKKNLIFDLDGTLWDSTKQIAIVWQNVSKDYNINITEDIVKSIMGLTAKEIATILFNGDLSTGYEFVTRCQKNEISYLSLHGRKYICKFYQHH